MPFDILVAVCLAYVILLFIVAFAAERRARAGQEGWLRSPVVYTLSLSIYCTAWTFYGAVGYAARSGLEFVTIYLGPTLVFIGWWWILRKLVRIGQAQRVTSIADLISARYGKSNILGVIVTVISVVAATPYIALQLQSVTLSFAVFAAETPEGWALPDQRSTALWVAGGLTLFTILFGTRNLDANERHHGIVTAIALEAVVKLVALLAVGVFVVWGVAGGVAATYARIEASPIADWPLLPGRWIGLTFVSAAAILTLPRMFQVMVVENSDERHLATASWAFPLYLMLMSLFVVPIAVVGLATLPAGSNPDLFVLTLPLALGQGKLAMLAFLGGFSSATSMVIVAAIALATMVSNHIVDAACGWPQAWWRAGAGRRARACADVAAAVDRGDPGAGLHLLPPVGRVGGAGGDRADLLRRRGADPAGDAGRHLLARRHPGRRGAGAGDRVRWSGSTRCSCRRSGRAGCCRPRVMARWPLGHRLAAAAGAVRDQRARSACCTRCSGRCSLNTAAFIVGSLVSFPGPIERMQGVAFVNVFDHRAGRARLVARRRPRPRTCWRWRSASSAPKRRRASSRRQARSARARPAFCPTRHPISSTGWSAELAGSVGAATAHAMIAQIAGRAAGFGRRT